MARRHVTGMAVAVLAVAVTAAACGSSGGGSSSSSSGTKSVTIGFQGPLSGDNQQLGINGVDGVKTAIAEANKKGDLPFTLKLAQSDDQGDPNVGPTAARSLIDNSAVLAVVGPMFSGATKASEPLFSKANLLSVSPSATNPALTTLGFTTFFRDIAPDTVQGAGAADYLAKTLKAKKIFSLDDSSEYGTGLSGAFEPEAKKDGATITHDSVNPTKDYTSEATKIIAAKPDAVYYSGYYAEFALLTKALKTKGYSGVLASGDGSNDDQFIKQAGAANANGVYLTCPCGDANSDPKAAAFVASYKATNPGQKPGTYSGEAYDATNAIITVLKQLGTGATRQSVATAFKSVNYVGLTKTLKFSATGEVAGSNVYIYQVKNAERTVLGSTAVLVKG
ncbi:MAG: branched-chain amino acid ABC transporter substrate-binding protein [Frankia sp.]